MPKHRQEFILGADRELGPRAGLVEGAAAIFKCAQRALQLASCRIKRHRQRLRLARILERHTALALGCHGCLLGEKRRRQQWHDDTELIKHRTAGTTTEEHQDDA